MEEQIMRARDAMFVWTPDRPPFDGPNFPFKGQVAVTTIPEKPDLKLHPMSYGASNLDWREMTDFDRKQKAQALISQMIHDDKIPENRVREAFQQVEEYAAFPFHTDPIERSEDEDEE
jgi:hypothetical protein